MWPMGCPVPNSQTSFKDGTMTIRVVRFLAAVATPAAPRVSTGAAAPAPSTTHSPAGTSVPSSARAPAKSWHMSPVSIPLQLRTCMALPLARAMQITISPAIDLCQSVLNPWGILAPALCSLLELSLMMPSLGHLDTAFRAAPLTVFANALLLLIAGTLSAFLPPHLAF